ncbi:MAG: tRNA pseudouridine(13) synthase TruD [Nanoarchaeota archaeon]|nr:tRNA pseudouridine(13) synthase TruD [Nanoarchaeota archaeon]
MIINDLGILEYYTKSKGISGEIKSFPKDFVVEEITPQGLVCSVNYSLKQRFNDFFFKFRTRKKFVRATLVKKDLTTLKCVRLLEKRFGRVGYAGIKDRKAVTSQRVSFFSKNFESFNGSDFCLKNFEYNHNRIAPGNLRGNVFSLRVRNNLNGVQSFVDELIGNNMFLPNFFGVQRFGIEKNTHKIGLLLVKREFEKAGEVLVRSNGFFEKKFKENSSDSVKAFRLLGNRILTFYVHALQSYIFNNALSKMIISGDQKKHLSLPGLHSKPCKFVKQQLNILKISTRDFNIPELRVKVAGFERKSFMRVHDLRVSEKEDLALNFRLDKGCYASIILNELCK